MTVYVNGVAKTLTLRNWRDGWNCGYSPDYFYELETNISDGQDLTEQEYADLVWFWETEVSAHNNGEYTEMFGDYDGTSIFFEYD